MIPMRFYPDRTLRIDLGDLDSEWVSLGYSEYCIRKSDAWTLEVKHSDDIDWGYDEEVPCHCQGLSHRNDCPNWVLPL